MPVEFTRGWWDKTMREWSASPHVTIPRSVVPLLDGFLHDGAIQTGLVVPPVFPRSGRPNPHTEQSSSGDVFVSWWLQQSDETRKRRFGIFKGAIAPIVLLVLAKIEPNNEEVTVELSFGLRRRSAPSPETEADLTAYVTRWAHWLDDMCKPDDAGRGS